MYLGLLNTPGVYVITNQINSKKYVGSSSNLGKRLYEHKRLLRKNKHPNSHLQAAWNKYGETNFISEIIALTSDKESLLPTEQMYLDLYCSSNPVMGYNISPIAGSRLGCSCSLETKQKLSSINLGKCLSKETRNKMSHTRQGCKQTTTWVAKRVAKCQGKKRSSEICKHFSDIQKGVNHPNFGKHLSVETRTKISQALKGRPGVLWSEERKAFISQLFTGKGNPFYGGYHIQETKMRINMIKKMNLIKQKQNKKENER